LPGLHGAAGAGALHVVRPTGHTDLVPHPAHVRFGRVEKIIAAASPLKTTKAAGASTLAALRWSSRP